MTRQYRLFTYSVVLANKQKNKEEREKKLLQDFIEFYFVIEFYLSNFEI